MKIELNRTSGGEALPSSDDERQQQIEREQESQKKAEALVEVERHGLDPCKIRATWQAASRLPNEFLDSRGSLEGEFLLEIGKLVPNVR